MTYPFFQESQLSYLEGKDKSRKELLIRAALSDSKHLRNALLRVMPMLEEMDLPAFREKDLELEAREAYR